MAEVRAGRVVSWRPLSSMLAVFRLAPAPGTRFPGYKSGQYMALRRDGCRLTRRVIGPDGRPQYVAVLDEEGRPKRGPVTHSYSIASAPFETLRDEVLEFYVVLERDDEGSPGRLTESLFQMRPGEDDGLEYVDRIVGDFTLDKRAAGFRSVLLVGTGTGLAPFASMIKQLHHESEGGRGDVRYTLVHANRTREELAYHEDLLAVEAAGALDFVYLPSVSRPSSRDRDDPSLGLGRANNLLRHVFDMPLKEEEDGDAAALERTVRPALPRRIRREDLRERLAPAETVVLTCGNPSLMADIRRIAEGREMRFEKEDW